MKFLRFFRPLIFVVAILVFHQSAHGQMYGRNFYFKFDESKYQLEVFASSLYDGNNYKLLKPLTKTIDGISFSQILFVNLKKTPNYNGTECYESIFLILRNTSAKNETMSVVINGFFDQTFNYLLNLDFKRGVFFLKMPTDKEGLLKLSGSNIDTNCQNVTSLLEEK